MKEKIEKMGFLKGVIILFVLGFLIGIGISLGFQKYFAEYICVFYDNLIENLTVYEIEQGQLFKKVILTEFRSFFLLVLFGISILGIPYLIVFLIYKGFISGFLFGSMLMKFGGKGILLGIVYGFPQVLFYVPVMIAIIHKNYYIGIQGLKKKLFWEQLPSIVVLMGILLIGCASEAYINSWIFKKILLWLV